MRVAIALLFGLTLNAPAALCQTYPDRPIRLISPNPAGGANDTIVRIIPAKMSPVSSREGIWCSDGRSRDFVAGHSWHGEGRRRTLR